MYLLVFVAMSYCFVFYTRHVNKILTYLLFCQVQMDVDVKFVQDHLKGDNITELRLKFVKRLEDAVPVGED